jgi:hypothetical protein
MSRSVREHLAQAGGVRAERRRPGRIGDRQVRIWQPLRPRRFSPLLSHDQIEGFRRDGFVVQPSVLSQEEVTQLRAYLADRFDSGEREPGDTDRVLHDVAARHSQVGRLLRNQKLLSTLRSLLGDDFVFLPEMAAHDSVYGTWHKDTSAQEAAGLDFQWTPDYLMVEAAIYLQDNGEYGGGLDVIPGSHKQGDSYIHPSLARKVFRKLTRYRGTEMPRNVYTIPNRAGDLVIFDFRIDHKATHPTACSPDEVPPQRRKLAVFFACSRDNEHVERYLDFIRQRPEYVYLNDRPPASELEDAAREQGFRLATV